jgi:hypothetical protein
LVRAEIIERVIGIDPEGAADAQAVVSGMANVFADLRTDLPKWAELGPELSVRLLEQHARLPSFVHAFAGLDLDPGQAQGT